MKISAKSCKFYSFYYIFLILGIFSCTSNAPIELINFYLPPMQLGDTIAMKYETYGKGIPSSNYFYVRTKVDSKTIHNWVVNDNNVLEQKSIETLLSNGVKVKSLTIFDGKDVKEVLINNGAAFPFIIEDTLDQFVFNISFETNIDTLKTVNTIIKNRQFIGFEQNEKGERIANLKVKNLIEQKMEGQGYIEPPVFISYEKYQENVGLIYNIKKISKDMIMEEKLVQTGFISDFKNLSINLVL